MHFSLSLKQLEKNYGHEGLKRVNGANHKGMSFNSEVWQTKVTEDTS